MDDFAEELHSIADRGLYRRLRGLPALGGRFTWNGRVTLNFSSNDYLDLARAVELKAAACAAIERYGCGATASRLMAGHTEMHARLEARIAEWTGMEAALVFGTGFQSNLGVLTALTAAGDLIFSDRLNHASLIDGCRLSKATVYRFGHNDVDDLASLLRRHTTRGRRFIVTESVFSMDGDIAPLRELRQLADAYEAGLIVDEAHALGVFGPNGAGVARAAGVRPDVLVGTMGKSLGSFGGFVAASRPVVEVLVNRARSFIYSTGLPPASAAAAIAAIDLLHQRPHLGGELLALAGAFHAQLTNAGLSAGTAVSQILPIVLGANETVMRVAQHLADDGLLVTGIRPPTVPDGTSRLRLSLTLAHTIADLTHAAECIAQRVQWVKHGAAS